MQALLNQSEATHCAWTVERAEGDPGIGHVYECALILSSSFPAVCSGPEALRAEK